MPLSVLQIINIAKASMYLASIDVQKGFLYSPRVIPQSAQMIYMELKAVEWMYNLDPSNSSLTETANYLYSICRGYNLEAQSIVSGGGGGLYIYQEDNLTSNYDLYLAGIPNIGDEVVVRMEDSLSNLDTFTYTAVSGDTAVTIMNNLVALINASPDFNAIYTTGIHPFISVQSNYGLTTVIGSSTISYAF
jgi:hypothetical protein